MQRRSSYNRARSRLLVIGILALCFLSVGIAGGIKRARQADRIYALKVQRMELNDQITALRDELSYVSSDAYIERVARDELGLMRPGEIRYVAG